MTDDDLIHYSLVRFCLGVRSPALFHAHQVPAAGEREDVAWSLATPWASPFAALLEVTRDPRR